MNDNFFPKSGVCVLNLKLAYTREGTPEVDQGAWWFECAQLSRCKVNRIGILTAAPLTLRARRMLFCEFESILIRHEDRCVYSLDVMVPSNS